MATKTKLLKTETVSDQKPAAKIPLTVIFTGDIFRRMDKMTKAKGFIYHQDLVRLAVAQLLDKSGY